MIIRPKRDFLFELNWFQLFEVIGGIQLKQIVFDRFGALIDVGINSSVKF